MTDLKSMLPSEIEEYLVNIGEKRFRAKQIFRWISAGETDIDNMTDLSVSLREKLKAECTVTRAKIISKTSSPKRSILTPTMCPPVRIPFLPATIPPLRSP